MLESGERSKVTNYHLFAKLTKKANFGWGNRGTITLDLWCNTQPPVELSPSRPAPISI